MTKLQESSALYTYDEVTRLANTWTKVQQQYFTARPVGPDDYQKIDQSEVALYPPTEYRWVITNQYHPGVELTLLETFQRINRECSPEDYIPLTYSNIDYYLMQADNLTGGALSSGDPISEALAIELAELTEFLTRRDI